MTNETIAKQVRLQESPAATPEQIEEGLRSGEGVISINKHPSQREIAAIMHRKRSGTTMSKRDAQRLKQELTKGQ